MGNWSFLKPSKKNAALSEERHRNEWREAEGKGCFSSRGSAWSGMGDAAVTFDREPICSSTSEKNIRSMDACMRLESIVLLYKGVDSFILLVGMKSAVIKNTEGHGKCY